MTAGQFRDVDPAGPIGEQQPFTIDPHAFDAQVGKVVNLRVNGEVVGHARLVAVSVDSVGLTFTLETPAEDEPPIIDVPDDVDPDMGGAPEAPLAHDHRWQQVHVDGNEYRTVAVADPRPPMPQPGLVCHGPGSCPVIDDSERGAWAGLPLNIVLEGDPRE